MTSKLPTAEQIAERFHEFYERLAPAFGYETRPETRKFDPASPNGKLMIAVCGELLRSLQIPEEPTPGLINSMCFRFNHGFGLLDESEQEYLRRKMRQVWEEVIGKGFYRADLEEDYRAMLRAAREK